MKIPLRNNTLKNSLPAVCSRQ